MIKSYSIVIDEIDDVEIALNELKTQMSEINLLRNSIGIASVHPEFIRFGIYAAIAKAVPFQLVGMTTISQTTNGKAGTFLFSILVLTSDTCEFASGESDAIPLQGGDAFELTQKCYKETRSKLEKSVKLCFMYAPFIENNSIHKFVEAVSSIDKRVPLFGSLACADIDSMAIDMKVVYGEHIFNDKMAMLLVSGDISPEFYIGSATKESIVMPNMGEVTASREHFVMEINNMNIYDFFEKIGFFTGGARNQGLLTSVFIADKKDNNDNIISSVSRSLLTLNNEFATFGGNIEIGSVLSLAIVTKDVVLTTTKDLVSKIKEKYNSNGDKKTVLMYSCVGRRYSLLDEPMKEYELLNEEFANNGFCYLASCSGGEFCPTSETNAGVLNSEHNQSLIACIF